MRTCAECGEAKPVNRFRYCAFREDKRMPRCAVCMDVHRPRLSSEERRRRVKDRRLRRVYGITVSDYERMMEEQGGVCALCGKEETDVRHGTHVGLSVDHCHTTGRVRGLLCNTCNIDLGRYERLVLLPNLDSYLAGVIQE